MSGILVIAEVRRGELRDVSFELIGAATALTIQSLVAVTAGHLLSLLPQRPVHIFAGGLFLVSAVLMWMRKEEAAVEALQESLEPPKPIHG